MPATNAVGERSFSALRQGKTYLRSTTGDSKLNHYMMLHVHKDGTDAPTLVDAANDFVGEKENRKQLFGKFSRERYPKQVLYFVKVNTNGKLETRTKGIVDKCSDLICTNKYALTEGPKPGGGGGELTWADRSAPPPFISCLLRTCLWIFRWRYQKLSSSTDTAPLIYMQTLISDSSTTSKEDAIGLTLKISGNNYSLTLSRPRGSPLTSKIVWR